MKTEFKESLAKDLKKVKDKTLLRRVKEAIEQVEQAANPQEIGNLKHLTGGDHYYRLRLGDYRIGLTMQDDTIVFVRFLNRKEIYRFFP